MTGLNSDLLCLHRGPRGEEETEGGMVVEDLAKEEEGWALGCGGLQINVSKFSMLAHDPGISYVVEATGEKGRA